MSKRPRVLAFKITDYNQGSFKLDKVGYPVDTDHAFRSSIEKWKTIVKNLEKYPGSWIDDGGRATCSLCTLHWGNDCPECPISQAGHPFCDGTPYEEYVDSGFKDIEAAKDELRFLKDLYKIWSKDN